MCGVALPSRFGGARRACPCRLVDGSLMVGRICRDGVLRIMLRERMGVLELKEMLSSRRYWLWEACGDRR